MSPDAPQPNTLFFFLPTPQERTRIRQLLKHLPKSYLSRYDYDNRFPLDLENNDFYSLLSDLNRKPDHDWRKRAVAAWVLGVSTHFENNRSVISEHLREVVSNRLQTKPKLYSERLVTAFLRTIVFGYPIATMILLCLFFMLSEGFNKGEGSFDFLSNLLGGMGLAFPCTLVGAFLGLPLILPFTITNANYCNNEARIMAVLSLHRQNVLEALPESLEGACDKSPAVMMQCRLALKDFLPQITEANRDLMPLNSEELLGKILEDAPDLALGNATLDYLEKFGTGRNCAAVAFYLKCLTHKANVPNFEEVYAKGQHVFALLQERRGRNQDGEQLLRHSIAPNAQPDELLRPATDSHSTPENQLLRAASQESRG